VDDVVARKPEHELTLLAGMTRALEAMISDIDNASRRVWIESYIVRDDLLGRKLADALGRARARGADVRLLFDALGSKNTAPEFIDALRAIGIDARPYRAIPVFPFRLFPRDHSRIVLADDVGYTGGSAWGDEWLPVEEGGKGWHDVCLRMRGPCVEELARIFGERWKRWRAGELPSDPSVIVAPHADLTVVSDLAQGADCIVDFVAAAVRQSKRRVWIENSYFFPPRAFLDELAAAAKRGVDVRILLPGESDLPICTRAARGEYRDWLGLGLRIAEFRRTIMHAKIAVVDDTFCTVGTWNINPTSFACSHELNVFVHDAAFVRQVAKQMASDFDESEWVTVDSVRRWSLLLRAWRALAARAFRALEWFLVRRRPRFLWTREAPYPSPS
jgi:cardiolipin synthase A/B